MHVYNRELKHINEMIAQLNLRLNDKTVLTEIGNNYYFFLPFIAALAGARKVYAWTAENKYFDCYQIQKDAAQLASSLGLESIIEIVVNDKPVHQIQEADIITNSGFLRPLDSQFLSHCKKGVAISLMFEKWELRHTDIDIAFCLSNGIKVAGINENHPDIKVFDSVGALACKLMFEAGLEIYQNSILIWSDDSFGEVTERYFRAMNAKQVYTTKDRNEFLNRLSDVDAVYFCSNHEKRVLISDTDQTAIFSTNEIIAKNPSVQVIHLYGKFNYEELADAGISVYPKQNGKAEYMSKTLTHLGMIPTLNLFCAGFKTTEELLSGQHSDLTQPF